MKAGHLSLVIIFPVLLVIILVALVFKNSMYLRKKPTTVVVNSTMGFSNPTYMSELQTQVESNYQDAVFANGNNEYIEVGEDDVFTEEETDSEEDE